MLILTIVIGLVPMMYRAPHVKSFIQIIKLQDYLLKDIVRKLRMKVGDLVKLKGPPLHGHTLHNCHRLATIVGSVGIVTCIVWRGAWIFAHQQHLLYSAGNVEVINETR